MVFVWICLFLKFCAGLCHQQAANSTDDLNDIVLHGFTFQASSSMHMYTWHDNLGPKNEAKRWC